MDQRPRPDDPLAPLSKRERMIAERFAEGLTYRQIGDALCIAPSTVRTHIAAIYRKLAIGNKAALIRLWAKPRHDRAQSDGAALLADLADGWEPAATQAWRIGGAIAAGGTRVDGSMPGWHAAIAVLPFADLSGDERWTRLAEGISADIITDLARRGDLTVIARSSSFAFRGRDVDAREIGRELGVRYLLEGSIQAAEGRVRVTARLIDAQRRTHLWVERYERREGDLYPVLADVVRQVAGALRG